MALMDTSTDEDDPPQPDSNNLDERVSSDESAHSRAQCQATATVIEDDSRRVRAQCQLTTTVIEDVLRPQSHGKQDVEKRRGIAHVNTTDHICSATTSSESDVVTSSLAAGQSGLDRDTRRNRRPTDKTSVSGRSRDVLSSSTSRRDCDESAERRAHRTRSTVAVAPASRASAARSKLGSISSLDDFDRGLLVTAAARSSTAAHETVLFQKVTSATQPTRDVNAAKRLRSQKVSSDAQTSCDVNATPKRLCSQRVTSDAQTSCDNNTAPKILRSHKVANELQHCSESEDSCDSGSDDTELSQSCLVQHRPADPVAVDTEEALDPEGCVRQKPRDAGGAGSRRSPKADKPTPSKSLSAGNPWFDVAPGQWCTADSPTVF